MNTDCDVAIVGAGPSGMAAAIYAGRAQLDVKVIERGMAGGQAAQTHEIENYPGFPEGVDGGQLSNDMKQQAERFGCAFVTDEVQDILRDGEVFRVVLRKSEIWSKTVVLSSGSGPRKLGVPGEAELAGKGVSYCAVCDGAFFKDKELVVIGGGDSALKESLFLTKFAKHLSIVHRRDEFRGEKIYQQQVFEHEKIDVIWDSVLESVNGDARVSGVTLKNVKTDEVIEHACDGVFIFVGTIPNTGIICNIMENECGQHIHTGPDMMTGVAGLFAIGDVRAGSYRQIATGVGEGAIAAIALEEYLHEFNAKHGSE